MQFILDILAALGDVATTIKDFFVYLFSSLENIFVYLEAWVVKVKFYFIIYSLKFTYEVASYLLEDIGFNALLTSSFNALPDEVRYYAYAFKLPQALSIYFNCVATAFVLKIQRMNV